MASVLVVDDEPDVLMLMRINLELEGHDVRLAADGEAGLAAIDRERPDVVLLDAMMPVMDGWAVLAALAERPPAERPPVVVVSAKAAPTDIDRALAAGAVDYVTKPFDGAHLMALVAELAAGDQASWDAHRAARFSGA